MHKKLPQYLKRPIIDTEKTKTVRKILKSENLNTVCENARCPNKSECYANNTATFLIMGQNCTRNCHYCNISCNKPEPLDNDEPLRVAKAIKNLNLKYAVITSVTRDDIKDGGAAHFAQCIYSIRNLTPNVKIEILTPDFKANTNSLDTIIKANPDVFNHNIETVKECFKTARPQGDYDKSLNVLKYIKTNSNIKTKSGIMIGLGETLDQIKNTFIDLKSAGCDILTVGQYIQPSKKHLPVAKYYKLDEYEIIKLMAKECGFKNFQIGPLVRSSYNASKILCSHE